MNKNKNYDYKKAQEATLKTLKQVDDNIWVMDYKCPYGLDAILEQGTKGIMDAVRFLQKEVKFPHLVPNPENDGFACSTYNAKTPDGDYILGRNFDYKAAPCLVCWTTPENGYKSMSVVNTTFFIHGTKYFPMSKATKQKTGKKPFITTVAIRATLDKCATVQEGIDLFASYDMQDLLGINYHYQLADAQGNSAIIEYVDNKMVVISQEEGKENLMLTNYFLTEGGDNHDGRGYDRYEKIETTLKAKNGTLTEDEAMKLLSEVTLYYRHPTFKHMVITLWSSVYNCTEKSMLMCAGMDYDTRYKFYVDKPCEITKVK